MSAWESLGKSDDWLTPQYIFDAMAVVFDLDVASPIRQTHVPARALLCAESLRGKWAGFIFMNPPFGSRNGVAPWLDKFVAHGNGVCLVPDRTSAPWFQQAAPRMDVILFLSPKVKFERLDGTIGRSPSTGTALMAIGAQGERALVNARKLGLLVKNVT
jgi:hypothetical protein